MVTATKPTVRANDVPAMRALQQGHGYTVTRTGTGWTVAKKDGSAEYHVTVDGRCDCPHFRERCEAAGTTCKHFAMSDLAERLGKVTVKVADPNYRPAPKPEPAPEPKGGKRWSEMTREEKIFAMCGPDC